jgi:hypothetical protein
LAKEDELVLGFASYEHNYQDNDRTQSTKYMYCPNKAKELNTLIDHIEELAIENHSAAFLLKQTGLTRPVLYQKKDFEIIEEVDIEIGHGYLMEDYVMEKRLLVHRSINTFT